MLTCMWYRGSDIFLKYTEHTLLQDNWRHAVDRQAVWRCKVCTGFIGCSWLNNRMTIDYKYICIVCYVYNICCLLMYTSDCICGKPGSVWEFDICYGKCQEIIKSGGMLGRSLIREKISWHFQDCKAWLSSSTRVSSRPLSLSLMLLLPVTFGSSTCVL